MENKRQQVQNWKKKEKKDDLELEVKSKLQNKAK